ncbi:MAG: hypothetical protein DRP81_06010 [Candidatus Omnitrophota bacterium]|nr:MAG: hypothetical protein DRP81_06010 [Candidatus Omnitrophota bacterium]
MGRIKDSDSLKRKYKKLSWCFLILFLVSCPLVMYLAVPGFLLLTIAVILGVKSLRVKRDLEQFDPTV